MAMDMTTALTIKANVVGQGQISGLQKGLGRVTGETKRATTAMGRLRGAAAGALGAMRSFLPVLGVAGIAAFAKRNLEAADSMSKLSQRTGIAAPTLDKFRKVAELSDTSIQSLERAFPALTKNMKTAADTGKGPMFEAFRELGVSITDAQGKLRATDAVMLDLADRFNGMADGSNKAALASTIFGTRIGSELIPLLNNGGDAVRNMGTALTQEFADKAAAFNDRVEEMQEKLGDLTLRLTEALLPALEALVSLTENVVTAFSMLPGPLQSIVASVTALGGAMLILSPIISAVTAGFGALAGLKIGATIAGYLPVITGLIGGLKTFGAIVLSVFSGPVGWAALLVAGGAAIFAFRDQIGTAFTAIGGLFADGFKQFKRMFVDPVVNAGSAMIEKLKSAFQSLGRFIRAPFEAARNVVINIVNSMIRAVVGAINRVIGVVNNMIRGANRALRSVGLGQLSTVPPARARQFAEGGVVNGPTMAVVGEGGEREYIVPESKMARASANYLGGMRGKSVIPAFADGGVVGPGAATGQGGGAANTTVQITTGPVLQQNNQNYVTVLDLERALKSFGDQVFRNSRTVGGRRYQGIY